MKFSNLKFLLIITLSLVINILISFTNSTETNTATRTKTSTKTQTKTHTKRSGDMMEYLSNFFSSDSDSLDENGNYKSVYDKQTSETKNNNKPDHRFKERLHFQFRSGSAPEPSASASVPAPSGSEPAPSTSGASPSASGASPTAKTGPNGMLEDWWQIASPMFQNPNRFPDVTLMNGKKVSIHTDDKDFRINDAYPTITESKPSSDLYFWFRLSGLHIYYSSSTTDLNILGAIGIADINDSNGMEDENGLYCIDIDDDELHKWHICNAYKETRNKWYCKIDTLLEKFDPQCNNATGPSTANVTIIEKNITQPIIIIPTPSKSCNEDWNYAFAGSNWECDCEEGKAQSPIDIPKTPIDSPIRPMFQYEQINDDIDIAYEENMIRVSKKNSNFGKLVTMDGAVYQATEIQIHTPGEHTIDGKKYDMEVQIIHHGITKGDIAKQAVLAFPFEKTPGVYNKFIDDLYFFDLPNPVTKKKDLQVIYIPRILYTDETKTDEINAMKPFSFYTYTGSLTSPPCYEDTIMYVAKPMQIGSTAISLFEEALRKPDVIDSNGDVEVYNTLPDSARKIQERNGRPVFFYDHQKYCGQDPVKTAKHHEGHYERVDKVATNYFYVGGKDPSKFPGAVVVPEYEAKGEPKPAS